MANEPECSCEYVDIGVGEQKVAENPYCPRCCLEIGEGDDPAHHPLGCTCIFCIPGA